MVRPLPQASGLRGKALDRASRAAQHERVIDPAKGTGDLGAHALEDLRYIRSTMARAGVFSAVPGRGLVLAGATALAAAWLARAARAAGGESAWLVAWLIELAIASTIAIVAVRAKAHATGEDAAGAPARRFFASFALPCALAAPLTVALLRQGAFDALPGVWLGLYGAALVAGWGAVTREVVPALGLSFVVLGVCAMLSPPGWGDGFMAAGFGGLHIGFGIWIARRFGG